MNDSLAAFEQRVALRYELYNRLFLNLPFAQVRETGVLLPLLARACEKGFEAGRCPEEIIEGFRRDVVPEATEETFFELLFSFVQYIERQVVLFDALEDASFEHVHDLDGEGSFPRLWERAGWAGKRNALTQRLQDLRLRIVLTAHPTQFYPDAVLGILSDLEGALRQEDLSEINQLLRQLGRTPFLRKERPTPRDEAHGLLWTLREVLYHAVPRLIQRIAETAGMDPADPALGNLLRMGFWPGGDRDGNPFVTAETTRDVAGLLRRAILECYLRDAAVLRRRLTFRGVAEETDRLNQRLEATRHHHAGGYAHAGEMLTDLLAIRKRLQEEHRGLFSELVTPMIIRLRCFGFHFATLDIRQDARIHQELTDAQAAGQAPPSPVHQDVLDTLHVVKELQESGGEAVVHRYIISNTGSPDDVLRVFHLARDAMQREHVPLDIVPLFETVPHLEAAPDTLRALLKDPSYREHLRQRGDHQTIMLGFSDGTKDGGFLAANWSIFRAKEEITAAVQPFGVRVAFFDGRGGPPARGGGKTHAYYAALGRRVADQEIQVTVQGQTVTAKFGTLPAALYNIEQILTASLGHALDADEALPEGQRDLVHRLAHTSREAYLELKQHPQFLPYLSTLGPLGFYSETNISSRPARRGRSAALSLDDLRAIPFVGTWHQIKQNVPGFYGLGTALQSVRDELGPDPLRALYRDSALFRALVENSMMALSKSFFPLTAHLEHDPEFGELWTRIHDEYQRTCRLLLELSGQDRLMATDPVSLRSVELRERIVLPLLTLQQAALAHLRKNPDAPLAYRRLIPRTMYGIINAGRNVA